jgi:cytochrome P450
MSGMWALKSPVFLQNTSSFDSRSYIESSDLPHPPFRLPFLGDVLGVNPRTPLQSSLPQMEKLGPISVRRVCGAEIIAVSGLDLVTEVHDETRFGKYVGLHLTPLREVVGDALITAETDHPDWRLAHDILKPAFSREAMQG